MAMAEKGSVREVDQHHDACLSLALRVAVALTRSARVFRLHTFRSTKRGFEISDGSNEQRRRRDLGLSHNKKGEPSRLPWKKESENGGYLPLKERT